MAEPPRNLLTRSGIGAAMGIAMGTLRMLLGRRRFPVWHDAAYRLPSAALEAAAGIEPRRADFVLWSLRASRVVTDADLRAPPRVSYTEMARVHTPAYLASLHEMATLARICGLDPADVNVDEILGAMRLACGATLAAAREAVRRGGPALNLLGGFHHAAPSRGGGLCALNDIAIAVAALRGEGFRGRVAVIDLDAHPPDGLAECFAGDPLTWIGSISGCDWQPLPGVDDTVLPDGSGDAPYLAALDALLARMSRPALAFVIAGGDVLAGDRLGRLGLTLDGARRRDQRVATALEGVASVWLPGGGYGGDSWKVLAGTGLVLAGRGREQVREGDPLALHFIDVSRGLEPSRLGAFDLELDLSDIEAELDRRPRQRRLLGFYTAEGLEYALSSFGMLDHLERLGYSAFRVAIDRHGVGDRARLYGVAGGAEHLLIETVLERREIAGKAMLFVHWLTLRHPRAVGRPLLPGQEVPGLGLAPEMGEVFERIAARLGLAGVAFRPAHYHTAFAARRRFRFLDAARQQRFDALVTKLAPLDLAAASAAVATGQVELDGTPYTWEADDMVDTIPG